MNELTFRFGLVQSHGPWQKFKYWFASVYTQIKSTEKLKSNMPKQSGTEMPHGKSWLTKKFAPFRFALAKCKFYIYTQIFETQIIESVRTWYLDFWISLRSSRFGSDFYWNVQAKCVNVTLEIEKCVRNTFISWFFGVIIFVPVMITTLQSEIYLFACFFFISESCGELNAFILGVIMITSIESWIFIIKV